MSEQVNSELPERFVIDNDIKAEWAISKIREADAERKRWQQHYDNMMQKVNQSCDDTINAMKRLLAEYFDTQPHKATKTQESYKLPSGDLVLKYPAVKFDTKTNKDELLAWVKENAPEYVKVEESVDWKGLKAKTDIKGDAVVTEWGEVVPGIIVTYSEPEFVVKVCE